MLAAIASALHIIGLSFAFLCAFMRERALKAPFENARLPEVFFWDNAALGAVTVWIGSGLWRLFGGLEKPTDWYLHNPMFHLKLGIFVVAWLLETWPMVSFIKWRMQLEKGIEPDTRHVPKFLVLFRIEMAMIFVGIFVASMMSRGIGYTPSATGFCAVEQTFIAECYSCHSASTRLGGLDLETDAHAALVRVASTQWSDETRVVPGDPARSLIIKKLRGTQGAHGVRMPVGRTLDPASIARIETWIRDGAVGCQ
jgi:putative membrane protein